MKEYIKSNNIVRTIFSKVPLNLRNKDYKYYLKTRKLIKETEYLSKSKLENFQFQKLKEIINYTWNNIEGYRLHWQNNGFEPSKLKSLEDINLIPYITKEILRDNLNYFSNKNLKKLQYVTTGGSTGIPFGFYQQTHNNMIELAFIHDIWSRFYSKIDLNTKKVILRGNKIDSIYKLDPISGLYISSYDINIENVKEYILLIEKYKYPIFHVYPSAIYQMAKIMKENSLKLEFRFEAIMFGSEPLYDFQKELINEVFNTKLCFWYGHSEKAILAGNCSLSDNFQIFPQYGITEVINNELIGTSFWNYATPFIRYKTMDFSDGNIFNNKSGRNYQFLNKIDGRLQEFIVSKSKKLISMTAINMHNDIFDDLEQFRFYQSKIGEVVFNYIPKNNEKVNLNKIYNGIKEKLSNEFELKLNQVNNIEKTSSGKLKFLEQELNINEFM